MTPTITAADHLLKAAVTQELQNTPEVTADHIGVAVKDGAVTLSGPVTSLPERQAAVAAALQCRGVTAVADNIVVEHHYGHLDDVDIAREAAAVLRASVVVPRDAVKVTVGDHRVTLTGSVRWHYQREAAVRLVSELPGVVSVTNRIVIAPRATLSPSQAEQRIRAALVRNAQTDARTIHVHVPESSPSTVELTGRVQSWAEYRQASNAAWATPGVTVVRNHIRVNA
jgi:osmotically-inducible protein OsmY